MPEVYVPVTIIRRDEKWFFSQIKNTFGRAVAIKDYYKLFGDKPASQEYILNQLRGKKYNLYDYMNDTQFNSPQELLLKYSLCKGSYPSETQRAYETMFRDPNWNKHKTWQRIDYLSRISTRNMNRVDITRKELLEKLDERFYKMDSAKLQLADVVVSNERTEQKGFNALLVGGTGVGKSAFMAALAEILNIPYEIIPLNGMDNTQELLGLDPGYDSADAGRFIKVFSAYGTSEMLIGLENIDNMNSHHKEENPMNALYQVLLGKLEDKFLGCGVSTENTIIIATANRLEGIPEPIKNRFDAIIKFDEYTFEDKVCIAERHVIPDIFKKYAIDDLNLNIPKEIIRDIAVNYCEDEGVRDLKRNLERIVRRYISDGLYDWDYYVSSDGVKEILSPLVIETPGLYFNRHREEYTEPVSKEIVRCLSIIKDNGYNSTSSDKDGKEKEKVDYLLSCRNEEGNYFDDFDPKKFQEYIHKNVYGMDEVIKEATLFYHTAALQGQTLNSNLALCGGFGIGKSTIVKNIAEAMGYNFVKIPLNGISDPKELRGFPATFSESEPGRIIKGVKNAGSLKTVFQLDEIDKLRPDIATVLIDLLDREFVDSFLDVPVCFEKAIFVATANDWGNVPPVLRDRFVVVNVDGYSREEKAEIVSDYIIPKIESGYSSSSVQISIDEEARMHMLDTYCTSFGVRDVEKAMQKIVSNKLFDQSGSKDSTDISIDINDVRKYLGEEPIPRGNFPSDGNQPGISKALAVTNGNKGSAFAIETVILDGDEGLEITGLPMESASDSVKIAVTCIKKMYPELLNGKYIHVHFGEGSVAKDGPSAGIALFMSILSAAMDKPLMINNPYDIAYTGEISLTGGVFAVGGLYEKIQAACDSGCIKVFVPMQNYMHLDQEKLRQFSCSVVPVTNVSQVVDAIFSKKECA